MKLEVRVLCLLSTLAALKASRTVQGFVKILELVSFGLWGRRLGIFILRVLELWGGSTLHPPCL